ncbi:heme o synthase [Paludibaculum fermentans]|uniref:Protoheme IX farnesyltransferase n=1 Tax=Paludibaculum fermentans TaxID=1473598 RepID=A0A7S7NK29_PALFE|nr:heme o synthase [Paludibaculum fermentans]QOY85047.1 protoheme IX farnesyltransferase [Paludibaculum fermentans]
MRSYLDLTKPRITWLILMSTGIGYFFGHQGSVDFLLLFNCLLGTALIASGTATLNQWYEHDADAKMNRTSQRPIPAGKVTPRNALLFGIALLVAGELQLGWGVNPLTAWLGLFTVASYLCLYTPMKQRTWWSTTVGAFPGAMPPLLGFAAARGVLTIDAWILFAIIFLWQFPHFYAIAWMYRDDYAKAGIQMLPVVEPDGASTSRQILGFALALIPISLLPSFFNMTGNLYLAAALVLGGFFLNSAARLSRDRTSLNARGVLKASVMYLPLLYLALIIDSYKLF